MLRSCVCVAALSSHSSRPAQTDRPVTRLRAQRHHVRSTASLQLDWSLEGGVLTWHVVSGLRLEKVPLEMTIADGVMIDCSREASNNRSYLVPVQKILDWESVYGRIPDQAAVIFNFGWSQYYRCFRSYMGTPNDRIKEFAFPAISKEAGLFLFDRRNITIIGTDTASPDPFDAAGLHIHMRYLPNNRIIVEDLKNPGLLPAKGFRFHASPVKYVGATGAQVRAYAMTYETEGDAAGYSGAPAALPGLPKMVVVFGYILGVCFSECWFFERQR
ncbi:hypothetical protein Btru_044160 [Bulinus truncatus]|nr:hypothetical protein Btru_044160 [Bulinus truncatus]